MDKLQTSKGSDNKAYMRTCTVLHQEVSLNSEEHDLLVKGAEKADGIIPAAAQTMRDGHQNMDQGYFRIHLIMLGTMTRVHICLVFIPDT